MKKFWLKGLLLSLVLPIYGQKVHYQPLNEPSLDTLYQYADQYEFTLELDPNRKIDSVHFWLDYQDGVEPEKSPHNRYYSMPYAKEVVARWEIWYGGTSPEKGSQIFTFIKHPEFKKEWETMKLSEMPHWKELSPLQSRMLGNYKESKYLGQKVPEWASLDIFKEEVIAKELWEKPVVYYFTSRSCGACIIEAATMDSIARKYQDQIQFVKVYDGLKPKDLKRYIEHKAPFIVIDDVALQDLHYITGWPKIWLVYEGELKKIIFGAMTYHQGKSIRTGEINPSSIKRYDALFNAYFKLKK